MKLYQFPKGNETLKDNQVQDKKMHLGPISFHCPNCNSTSELHYPGMIMRCVEFNCGDCGSYFKVTNPAFSNKTK